MEIRLERVNYSTRYDCCICGGLTGKKDVYPICHDDQGTEFGFVCDDCMESGPGGIKSRIREHSQRLKKESEGLAMWADALDGGHEIIQLPDDMFLHCRYCGTAIDGLGGFVDEPDGSSSIVCHGCFEKVDVEPMQASS